MKRSFTLTIALVLTLAFAGVVHASPERYLAKAEAGMTKIFETKDRAETAAKALEGVADPEAHYEALSEICTARAAYLAAVESVAVQLSMAVSDAGEAGKWQEKTYVAFGNVAARIGAGSAGKDGMSFIFFALKECGDEDLKAKTLLARVAADQLNIAVCRDLEALGQVYMILEELYPDATGLAPIKDSIEKLFSSM